MKIDNNDKFVVILMYNLANKFVCFQRRRKNKEPQIIQFSKKQEIEAYKKYQELENKYKNNKKVEIVMFSINNGKKNNKI